MLGSLVQSKKILFLLFLSLFFAVQYYLFNHGTFLELNGQSLPDWPLFIDLLITLPLVYWLIFKPTLKQLLIKTLILFSLGVLVGSMIIPQESQLLWPYLIELRYLIIIIFIGIELSLLVSLLHIIKNYAKDNGFIEQEIESFLDKNNLTKTFKQPYLLEARIWLYAFLARKRKLQFEGKKHFRYAHYQGNASNQQGFIFIILFELPIAHFILHFTWSATAAYWVSGLTLYGLIFMYADYRATLTRPISITDKTLIIRYGVWGNLKLPLSAIAKISTNKKIVKRSKSSLRFCQFGTPNISIELKPNTELQTPFGKSCKKKIYLGIENPNMFLRYFNND